MKVPHLDVNKARECWLATLNASFCDNVTCVGTSKVRRHVNEKESPKYTVVIVWKAFILMITVKWVGLGVAWAHESTSLEVNKANGILAGNTKHILWDNVTCVGTKSCSNKSHLQECFNCSSLLACKGTAFNLCSNYCSLSPIHLTASLYLCPADCFQDILLEQARNSHWNKLAFLRHIKWHICSVGAWNAWTLTWCQ